MKIFKKSLCFILVCLILWATVFTGNAQENNESNTSLDIKCTLLYDEAFRVLNLTNNARIKNGLEPLIMDTELLEAAMQRAAEIVVYFSHTRPDGSHCLTVHPRATGENIATVSFDSSAEMAVGQWLSSPGHYKNMMRTDIKTAGMGVVEYNGLEYWVQIFGSDLKEAATSVPENSEKIFSINFGENTSDLEIATNNKLFVNDSCTLTLKSSKTICTFENNGVQYFSDNPSVISINGNIATAHKEGSATIIARNGDIKLQTLIKVTDFKNSDNSLAGENISWSYENGTLTFKGNGKMYDFKESDIPWKDGAHLIKRIVVEEGITDIGDYVIYNLPNLTEVQLPDSVEWINSYNFIYCENLAEIIVSDNNENYMSEDGILYEYDYYYDQYSLLAYPPAKEDSTFTVPHFVFYFDFFAFDSCKNLKELNIGDTFDSYLSDNIPPCVEKINISENNPEYSSVDGVLFDKSGEIINVYPPGKTDEKYTTPKGVTAINSYAFINNPYIKEITFSEDIKEINKYSIENCENLGTVYIPAGVEDIGDNFIYKCPNISSIYYAGTALQWNEMNITLQGLNYSGMCPNGLYVYCSDGTIELVESRVPAEPTYPNTEIPTTTAPTSKPENTTESTMATEPTETTVSTNPTTTPSTEPSFSLGDVNQDGKINIRDATTIQKYIAKMIDLSEDSIALADFDQNSKVNVKDATAIQKHIAFI